MSLEDLPALNACLNALSTVFLSVGFYQIKRGNKVVHRNCMVAALVTSAMFLTSYLIYHAYAGRTDFVDPSWFRPIYLLILVPHIILAALMVPMILATVFFAIKGSFESHRKIARWTWPIWMYVSVTGVLIYLLLYHIFPQQ